MSEFSDSNDLGGASEAMARHIVNQLAAEAKAQGRYGRYVRLDTIRRISAQLNRAYPDAAGHIGAETFIRYETNHTRVPGKALVFRLSVMLEDSLYLSKPARKRRRKPAKAKRSR